MASQTPVLRTVVLRTIAYRHSGEREVRRDPPPAGFRDNFSQTPYSCRVKEVSGKARYLADSSLSLCVQQSPALFFATVLSLFSSGASRDVIPWDCSPDLILLTAAFWSWSLSIPQSGQECTRTDPVSVTIAPHLKHCCGVFLGTERICPVPPHSPGSRGSRLLPLCSGRSG